MSIPTVSELEQTLGVILVGYVVAMVALGITVFQTYVYYSKYTIDDVWSKTVVGSLCFLDVIMSILVSHAIYHYLIAQYPFTTGLIDATSTFSAELGLSVIALFIVQLFYASHTWRATKNVVVSVFITSTSFAGFVLGLVVAANLVRDTKFASLAEGSSKIVMITSQSFVFFSSLLTAGALLCYMHPSMNPSTSIINGFDEQVATYLISPGALSALFQLGFVVLFAAYPSKPLWMPFQFLSSKVFTNSLLTSLNSRKSRNGRPLDGGLDGGRIGRTPFNAQRASNVRFNAMESRLEEHVKGTETSRTDSDTIKKSILDGESSGCWQDEIEHSHTTSSASTNA